MLLRKGEFRDASDTGERSLVMLVQRPGARRAVLAGLAALALIAIGYWFFAGGKQPAAAMPPAAVTVAYPLQRTIIEYDEFTGRFEPSRTVEIRPRVSGQLRAVHFRDGDYVRQGQLLFTIDPRPFQAALAEARAHAAAARASARLAAVQLSRAQGLVAKGFVSRDSYDIRAAADQSARADIAAADAIVRQRALDLEFTQVRAPVSGRISDRRADPGSLLAGGNGGDATLLTTINAVEPIYFAFDVSEALLLKAQRERGGGSAPQQVEIRLQDEPDYRWHGTVDFTDNGIERNSGTIRARAVVANPQGFLVPGIFGSMRLSSRRPVNVLLVPDSAVIADQAGKAVMTIGKDGKAMPVPVSVGPVIDGLRVIRGGLAPDAKVVIRGHQRMFPGLPIKATLARITPEPSKTASPAASPPPASSATFASSNGTR
jgi:RND family efflux transporter MFP subunit